MHVRRFLLHQFRLTSVEMMKILGCACHFHLLTARSPNFANKVLHFNVLRQKALAFLTKGPQYNHKALDFLKRIYSQGFTQKILLTRFYSQNPWFSHKDLLTRFTHKDLLTRFTHKVLLTKSLICSKNPCFTRSVAAELHLYLFLDSISYFFFFLAFSIVAVIWTNFEIWVKPRFRPEMLKWF